MTVLRAHGCRALLTALVALILMIGVFAFSPAQEADADAWRFNSWEKCLMRGINHERQDRGLNGLSWDRHLGYVAGLRAAEMARYGYLWHDPNIGLKITRWDALGENVGRGAGCYEIHEQLMASPSHRRIILGDWRHVGVGAEWMGGVLYVEQIFERYENPGNIWGYP